MSPRTARGRSTLFEGGAAVSTAPDHTRSDRYCTHCMY
jgi:hypothetical protein